MFKRNGNYKYLMTFLSHMEDGDIRISNKVIVLNRKILQENDIYKLERRFNDISEFDGKIKKCILLSISFISKSRNKVDLEL